MICAQFRTKTRSSIPRKICSVKSGFQILYAEEQVSSPFSKDNYWHLPIDETGVKEKYNSYAYPLQIIYKQFKVK